ncbi:replication-relaxation family protein [Pseudobdellovibrio sp. HCB154]|uniref:replication-relaxation family protein n=1 Tax=Pseudobdellovibrio sp. HCB154 TaxID=3386277 RepID=UPI00391749D2
MTDTSKKLNVLLTDRDCLLLLTLYENVTTSFYQIQNLFFRGKNHATAMNRLRQLEDAGYLSRTRIPRIRSWNGGREVGVVFQVTTKSLRMLQMKYQSENFVDKIPAINPLSLDHDLLINDIKPCIQRQFDNGKWINGRHLLDSRGYKKIPDAVIEFANSDRVIAIELELHTKSSIRYRQIISEFRASSKIEKVIYVTASAQIDRKIISELEGFQVPNGYKTKSEIFSFIQLAELLGQTTHQSECLI